MVRCNTQKKNCEKCCTIGVAVQSLKTLFLKGHLKGKKITIRLVASPLLADIRTPVLSSLGRYLFPGSGLFLVSFRASGASRSPLSFGETGKEVCCARSYAKRLKRRQYTEKRTGSLVDGRATDKIASHPRRKSNLNSTSN